MTPFTSSPLPEQLAQVVSWAEPFDALTQRLAPRFARTEARQHMREYLQGLLSPIKRKNGWQLAEYLGNATPYGIQHLLGRAQWDADLVRDDLQRYLLEHLQDPQSVGVLDESGSLKRGDKSVGVARQYAGTAGRVENSQIGVFLTYASPKGHSFLDRELYLPKEWTDDQERCREAAIPQEVTFATKPQLAQRMLERAFEAGLSLALVTGDSVYGGHPTLRHFLEARPQPYVLAVAKEERLCIGSQPRRADDLAASLPASDWQRLRAGQGARGSRL
jgi:SRSO17 transposase